MQSCISFYQPWVLHYAWFWTNMTFYKSWLPKYSRLMVIQSDMITEIFKILNNCPSDLVAGIFVFRKKYECGNFHSKSNLYLSKSLGNQNLLYNQMWVSFYQIYFLKYSGFYTKFDQTWLLKNSRFWIIYYLIWLRFNLGQ